jgi:MFS family permease
MSSQLLNFFLPVFYFNTRFPFMAQFGFSSLKEGVLNVALVYLLTYLTSFLSGIIIAKILLKRGIKNGFIIGHLFYCLFILCLYFAQDNPYLVLTAAVINGLQNNFFWNSYHYSLSKIGNEAKIRSSLGLVNLLLNLLSMIAPALAGLIITSLGFTTLFLLSLVVVLGGVLFSVLLDNITVRDKISFKEFRDWLQEPGFRRLALSFSGSYFNNAGITLWAIYMYVLLGNANSVGYFYSLSLLTALFISYAISSFLDKNKSRKQFNISGSFLSCFWILRAFVVNIWSITILNAVDKLVASYHWLFFDRAWILRGKGREALSYFVYREMIYSFAAVVFWLLVMVLFCLFANAWKSLFVMAGIGVLLTLLIKEHKDINVED